MTIIEFIEWVSLPDNYNKAIKSCVDIMNKVLKEL